MKHDSEGVLAKRLMSWMRRTNGSLLTVVLVASIDGNAYADTDPCQSIRDAIGKQNTALQMQVTSVLTYTDSGRSYYLDSLYSGDRYYWRNREGPWDVEQRRSVPLFIDGKAAIYNCRFVGTDRIGDTAVNVYDYRRSIPDHTLDIRAWISVDGGEFLQSETVFGPFPDHKAKYTFSYGPNPAPPAVDERKLWHAPH